MPCNRTDGMPRGDFNIYFASSRRGYVRAEEYVYPVYFDMGCTVELSNRSFLYASIEYSYMLVDIINYDI